MGFMRRLTFLTGIFTALVAIVACEKQSMVGSPEAESLLLERLRNEIDSLASSYLCQDASEWHFTPVGEKPCGGPASYVAYSTKMDTVSFLNKVEIYTDRQRTYNVKW